MHKQNQGESASDESLKKFPNCVAKLVKLENSQCIIILAFKDISKYVSYCLVMATDRRLAF